MKPEEPCPRIEAISALIDDELQAAERPSLEAHVAACPLCGPVHADFLSLRRRLAALPRHGAAFDVAAAVDRRIAGAAGPAPARTRAPGRRRWWQVVVLAPGGAAAIVLGVWLGGMIVPVARPPSDRLALQMQPFAAQPAGALCPLGMGCGGSRR